MDATWLANPGSSDWNTGSNWSTGSTPGLFNTATFGASTITSINIGPMVSETYIGRFTFQSGAPAYTFNVLSGATLAVNYNEIYGAGAAKPRMINDGLVRANDGITGQTHSLGSIEGTGNWDLALSQYTVGGNKLSTTVSGNISSSRANGWLIVDYGTGYALTLSGTLSLNKVEIKSGTLELANSGSITQDIAFVDPGSDAILKLDYAQQYTGHINNIGLGNIIDLPAVHVTHAAIVAGNTTLSLETAAGPTLTYQATGAFSGNSLAFTYDPIANESYVFLVNGTAQNIAGDFRAGGANDFTGDGNGDILLRHDSGQIYLWGMNGPVVTSSQQVAFLPNDWHIRATGDFNGDGKTDILLRHDGGQIYEWLMDGAQVTASQQVSVLPNDWHIQGTGDFNGDGKTDILLRHDGGQIYEWQMDGAQVVASQQVAVLPNDWHVQGTGDFNGDGKTDILLRTDNGQIFEWQMNGASVASSNQLNVLTFDWHIQGTGDFNGDGKDDILLRNDSGQIYEWQMNGTEITASQQVAALPLDWQIQGTGDFNNDGKADILLRHDGGQVYEWQMNGAQVVSSTEVSVLPLDWHIATYQHDFII